jgi:hypothetical protein
MKEGILKVVANLKSSGAGKKNKIESLSQEKIKTGFSL